MQVDEVVHSHITETTDKLIQTYTTTWQQNMNQLSNQWIQQVTDHFARLESSMQEKMDEKALIDRKAKLTQILEDLEGK